MSPAPAAAARDLLAAPDDEHGHARRLCSRPRAGSRATTAPRSGLTLKCDAARRDVGRVPGGRLAGARGRRSPAARPARWSTGSSAVAARRRCAPAARALKRPVWDVLDRLARVGAVALRVEPPDTDAAALTERVADARGRRAHPARARYAVPARPASSGGSTRRSSASAGARSVRHVTGQLGLQRRRCSGRWSSAGWCASVSAERLRDPFAAFPGVLRRRPS